MLALREPIGSSPFIIGSILVGADDLVAEMVRVRIPHVRERGFGPCKALGVIRRGKLVGGVVYNKYNGFDVHMSAAFEPGWATPDTLRALFAYPFIDLDCKRVSTMAGRKNKKARAFNEKLGFTLEGVKKRGLDGFEDGFCYGMVKQDCRWIRTKENG